MILIMVNPLSSNLPEPLNSLADTALRLRTLTQGTTLFHQGQKTHGLFYLLSGAISLQRVTDSGHEVLVLRCAAKETFAEASLFHPNYHCQAIATQQSEVIECSKRDVLARFQQDTQFAMAMSERFANQVQQTRARLELRSIRGADERVFRALADGLMSDSVRSFAHEIGLAPEVVYRSLASLTRSGRIQKVGYGRYSI